MTIFSTNLGGGEAPLALPRLRLCFGPPLGNFLRTPLVASVAQLMVMSYISVVQVLLTYTGHFTKM